MKKFHIERLFSKGGLSIHMHLLAAIVLVVGLYYVWLWSVLIAGIIEFIYLNFAQKNLNKQKFCHS